MRARLLDPETFGEHLVRSERCQLRIVARIARGVVTSAGRDTKGYANVLTDDRSAPCGATTYNTNQVEVMHLRIGDR